jgi:hypothetical protein
MCYNKLLGLHYAFKIDTYFGVTESTVVCRLLCSTASRNRTADINWNKREPEITLHESHVIKGVEMEGTKCEVFYITTAVLLDILMVFDVTSFCVQRPPFWWVLIPSLPNLSLTPWRAKVQRHDPWNLSCHSHKDKDIYHSILSCPHIGQFIRYCVSDAIFAGGISIHISVPFVCVQN